MKSIRMVLAAASVAAISSAATAAIDYTNPTYSVAVTRAEVEAVSGTNSSGATFFSTSFIPDSTAGNILLIQDPSGGTGSGTGLIRINLTTKIGAVIANDTALNTVADDNATADQDTNGLALDPGTGTVYLSDREDDDEIIAITSAGAVSNLAGATIGAGAYLNGIVFSGGNLYYCNEATDTVMAYNIGTGIESTLVSTAAYTAVSGGTLLGSAGGPVLSGSNLLIFDDTTFAGGTTDKILRVALPGGAVSEAVASSVFGVGTEPGFSTFVVTSDGTIIAWDEFGAGAAALTFLVIPQGTGTPIRFTQASVAAALGLSAAAAVDPTDENSMMVLTDTPTEVSVLIGLAGNTTTDTGPVGGIAKMTFTAAASVPDWTLY
jgi:hypothetical protein